MPTGSHVAVARDLPRRLVVGAALAILVVVALVGGVPGGRPAPGAGEVVGSAAGDCRYLDPPGRDLRLLFVGDSMTQGRSGSATYRYWTWRGLHSARRDVEFVGPATALNGSAGTDVYEHLDAGFGRQRQHAARGGATFASSRAEYPPARLVRDHHPDVIVLQLGFNDSNRVRTTPAQLAARFDHYIASVWALAPSTRFVLGQIPPAEGGPGKEALTAARNLRTAAANRLVGQRWADDPCRVQVNDLRTGTEPAWDPVVHTYDGAHPGPAGETLMADRMLAAMARLGVLREPVSVYDPDVTWDPRPVVTVGDLGEGRIQVDWADERARLSASGLRLRIGAAGAAHETRWFRSPSVTLDLAPGVTTISAIVERGLPGRMVSAPGSPREILVH